MSQDNGTGKLYELTVREIDEDGPGRLLGSVTGDADLVASGARSLAGRLASAAEPGEVTPSPRRGRPPGRKPTEPVQAATNGAPAVEATTDGNPFAR